MVTCPACHGERGIDVSSYEEPLALIAEAIGMHFEREYFIPCDFCDGAGEVTEDDARDYAAYWNARVSQLTAAVDAGDVVVP